MRRRDALTGLLAAATWWSFGSAAHAQKVQAPRIGRYRVYRVTAHTRMWIRDLVIESAKDYAVYEHNKGPLYGRGTFSFDGQYARFLTGPFHELGYFGSSFVQPDGKHNIRLGNSVEAISEE